METKSIKALGTDAANIPLSGCDIQRRTVTNLDVEKK